MTSTLKLAVVLFSMMISEAFALDLGKGEWVKLPAPDRPYGLQKRPAVEVAKAWRHIEGEIPQTANGQNQEPVQPVPQKEVAADPPPPRQGDPSSCFDGEVIDRVTNKLVQRNKWSDFFLNRSYIFVRFTNTLQDDTVFVEDGFAPIAKNVCANGSVTFAYQFSPYSRKNPKYIMLRAVSHNDRSKRYDSPQIPLWVRGTTMFRWDLGDDDTKPSASEFEPDANFDGFNDIRDAQVERRVCEERAGYYWRWYGSGCRYYPNRGYGGRQYNMRGVGNFRYCVGSGCGGYSGGSFYHPSAGGSYVPGAGGSYVPGLNRTGFHRTRHYVGGGGVIGGGAIRCSDPRCFSGFNNTVPLFK